jgi:hypothetical protein
MVLLWIVVFTGLRAAVMDYVLKPFAQWAGVTNNKTQTRLAEQAWMLLYYIVFWTLGMVSLCDWLAMGVVANQMMFYSISCTRLTTGSI